MNKVILMGRLTRDPETSYAQSSSEPLAITKYSLAVNRRFKRPGEPEADFINCVSFGKSGEFAQKYFKKGQMVSVVGRIQVSSWEDPEGKKRWKTDVIVEEQYFAESKSSFESHKASAQPMPFATEQEPSFSSSPMPSAPKPEMPETDGFYPIDESIEDDDLPF